MRILLLTFNELYYGVDLKNLIEGTYQMNLFQYRQILTKILNSGIIIFIKRNEYGQS